MYKECKCWIYESDQSIHDLRKMRPFKIREQSKLDAAKAFVEAMSDDYDDGDDVEVLVAYGEDVSLFKVTVTRSFTTEAEELDLPEEDGEDEEDEEDDEN